MWENGRPRYWVGWWDTWHLILPGVTVALMVWLARLPRPASAHASPPRAAEPVRAQPESPRPLAVPIVDTPRTGTRIRSLPAGRLMADVTGKGFEAGLTAALFYTPAGRPETFLTRTSTDAAGRFRFGLSGFPPGTYRLRVATYAADGRKAVSVPVEIVVVR